MWEAEDIEQAFGGIATSDEPFDQRFREFLKVVHGIDELRMTAAQRPQGHRSSLLVRPQERLANAHKHERVAARTSLNTMIRSFRHVDSGQ